MKIISAALRIVLVAALLAWAVAGCSFSYSSESISGSSDNSSKSSSSSSPSDKESAYRDDVRDYTYAYVESSKDSRVFFQGLAKLAERHGVSDWEADRVTWTGIGEGLAKADVSGATLESYKQSLTGADPAQMAKIQEGYDAYGAS